MTTPELLALHQETCEAARKTMQAKNHDYTAGSGDPFANFRASEAIGIPAELGVLMRLLDKMKRMETFIRQGTLQVKTESVDDAIEDGINYLILLKGLIADRKVNGQNLL